MTSLRQHAEEYLTARRALGFKLRSEGYLLTSFVTFADQAGAELITTEVVVAWTLRAVDTDHHNLAKRMRVVRFFARYLYAIDPRNEVPPDDLYSSRGHRPTPYIYSDAEVAALMNGAKGLDAPLLAITMEALIGLLATTGMRIGEAIALDCGDVNWDESLLTVRNAKYGKSREVLLHPSTVQALRHYVGERNQLVQVVDHSVFVSTRGTRINYSTVRQTFSVLRRRTFVLVPTSAQARTQAHVRISLAGFGGVDRRSFASLGSFVYGDHFTVLQSFSNRVKDTDCAGDGEDSDCAYKLSGLVRGLNARSQSSY